MKILSIIKIKDGTPQVIEAFVFYKDMDDNVIQEITDRAEYRFCKLLGGPGYEIESIDKKVYQTAIMEGYRKGIIIMNRKNEPEYSLHLAWCNIKE